jgi:hypothetical protein
VHHFTLLDVFARGYVRPICMSYITRHPTKIMDNFASLMKKFNKVPSPPLVIAISPSSSPAD